MKRRWAVLALVALGTFMTTLDASIVNIGLPSIARSFHTPIGSAVEWVIIAYLIVIAAGTRTREPLDVPGAACLAIGLALLTITLSFGQEWGWTSPRLLTCLSVTIVALVGAGVIERRVRHPIVDLALLRDRVLASALGSLTPLPHPEGLRWPAWACSCWRGSTRRARSWTSSGVWCSRVSARVCSWRRTRVPS